MTKKLPREQLEREFHQVLERQGSEREEYLASLHAKVPELATALRRLIALDAQELDAIDRPVLEQLAERSKGTLKAFRLPLRVGRYKILTMLGRGGMGIVYEASQENPHRRVALKLLRPELVGTQAQGRFTREGQILARLQHAGIAHIYESGLAEVSWPGGALSEQAFLAMELIHGLPPREFAEAHALSVEDRIHLLIKICDAVECAHRAGIVHRDLKPQNILVTEERGKEGTPKVLDFGVARLLDSQGASMTLQTNTGQVIGTVAYMSPEQVAGDRVGISPRTDVYALGILAFELLTGKLPYKLKSLTFSQAARIIQEEEPTRLGTWLAESRGDLETILETALDKDPSRRYDSAGSLGADFHRYLAHEPIQARPSSRIYRMQKFTRRHRGLVFGTAATILVLVLGVIGTTTFALRSAASETRTQRALKEARRETKKAEEILRFLDGMLTSANPNFRKGGELTVVELVDAAAKEMDNKPPADIEVEIAVRTTLGDTYRNLSKYQRSVPQFRRALKLAEKAFGSKDPRSTQVRIKYTRVLVETQKFREAERELKLCAQSYQAQGKEGNWGLTQTLLLKGQILTERREFEEAARVANRALDQAKTLQGEPILLADCYSQIAFIRVWQGKYKGTEALYRKALALREKTGINRSLVLQTLSNIASLYMTQGRAAEAESLYAQVLERTRRELGKEHQMVPTLLLRLAMLREEAGKSQEAVDYLRESLRVQGKVMGAASDLAATASWMLGRNLARLGDRKAAIQWFRSAHKILLGSQDGNRTSALGYVAHSLASLLFQEKAFAESATWAQKSYDLHKSNFGKTHPGAKASAAILADIQKLRGHFKKAAFWRLRAEGK
jgi:tetratricopeptide (TPR) repeat protein/tRNA A-37 threonylcarbamoyl transferase component Bud32